MPLAKVLLIGLVVLGAANAASDEKQLEESLKSKYELAKTGLGRLRVTKTGTVLVIQKDGIYASPSADTVPAFNKFVDGELTQKGGFLGSFGEKANNRALKAGETVYAIRIGVRRDEVRFDIITCDDYQVNLRGGSRETRYAATIAFDFPKDSLETADAESVKKVVDSVLLPQGEVQSAKTKTVELGQTPDQVKAALGAPEKIVKLGPKEIYVYKDMKVVFVDGKVSDVQ